MTTAKYPVIEVTLIGRDGNALAILGNVRRAMELVALPASEIDAFTAEALSGDYDHLLTTVMKWVTIK